jgi:hypothetical protein
MIKSRKLKKEEMCNRHGDEKYTIWPQNLNRIDNLGGAGVAR